MPQWMSSIEGMSPRGTAGIGFLLAVANPKELAFIGGAGLTIGAAGLTPVPTIAAALGYAIMSVLFLVIGSMLIGDGLGQL